MKTVILAGGLGTRLAEETGTRPKPMVEIGGEPMLLHIMGIYAHHGFNEFVIAAGYKGEMIKGYFRDFFFRQSDLKVDLKDGSLELLNPRGRDWLISVIDTGTETMTGGRIGRVRPYLDEETFMVTYGDGLGDVDIKSLVAFHRAHGKLATVTSVRPQSRFGAMRLSDGAVREFSEKPHVGEGWINGGFFVFEPGVLDYLGGDEVVLEREPLERLAADGELMAFEHEGFWQPMDTLREKQILEDLWQSGGAPWTFDS